MKTTIATVIMILAAFATSATEQTIMWHQPYLQNISPEGVTIMYQTRKLSTSRVEFGTDTTTMLRSARQLTGGQEVVHDLEHRVRLDSLRPGTTYYYRITGREILVNKSYHKEFGPMWNTPFYKFTTPEVKPEKFTAIVFNDLHGHKPTIERLAKLAASTPHDLIIFNGDCLSEPASRQDAVEELHTLANVFGLSSKPAIFIRGNHEIRNAYSSGAQSLFDRPEGLTYGAQTYGDIRFVTLDCGEDKPDTTWVYYGLNDFTGLRHEQVKFLERELASEEFGKAPFRVLIHHIPVWGNTDDYQPCTDLWAPILAGAPFDVDIAAHTHEFNTIERGEQGQAFPVIIGGGYEEDSATTTVIQKIGDNLTVTVFDINGNELARPVER